MPLTIIRPHSKEFMTRKEAAHLLGIKEQTLAKWASVGRYDLPYIKVGKAVRYRRADIESYLTRNTVGGGCDE